MRTWPCGTTTRPSHIDNLVHRSCTIHLHHKLSQARLVDQLLQDNQTQDGHRLFRLRFVCKQQEASKINQHSAIHLPVFHTIGTSIQPDRQQQQHEHSHRNSYSSIVCCHYKQQQQQLVQTQRASQHLPRSTQSTSTTNGIDVSHQSSHYACQCQQPVDQFLAIAATCLRLAATHQRQPLVNSRNNKRHLHTDHQPGVDACLLAPCQACQTTRYYSLHTASHTPPLAARHSRRPATRARVALASRHQGLDRGAATPRRCAQRAARGLLAASVPCRRPCRLPASPGGARLADQPLFTHSIELVALFFILLAPIGDHKHQQHASVDLHRRRQPSSAQPHQQQQQQWHRKHSLVAIRHRSGRASQAQHHAPAVLAVRQPSSEQQPAARYQQLGSRRDLASYSVSLMRMRTNEQQQQQRLATRGTNGDERDRSSSRAAGVCPPC